MSAPLHPPGPPHEPPPGRTDDPEGAARFRATLLKVMSVQLVALFALWWLQARYHA